MTRSNVRPCPTCQRDARKDDNPAFPFCSPRCRAIDLGRWLNEDYRIPVECDGGESPEPASREIDGER